MNRVGGIEQHLQVSGKFPPATTLREKSAGAALKKKTLTDEEERSAKGNRLPKALPFSLSANATVAQSSVRRKLAEKLDDIYLTTGRSYNRDLWELSDYTPTWMKGKS
jgi:hypothetical protein